MHRSFAKLVLAGAALALPAWALAQTPMPVIPAVPPASHAKARQAAPVWRHDGNELSVTASGRSDATVPGDRGAGLEGRAHSAGAGVRLTTRPGVTAHAEVREVRWAPLLPACTSAIPGGIMAPACQDSFGAGMQRGEVGAGFSGRNVKFDVSVGQSQSDSSQSLRRPAALPRVLPAEGGADVAAPLWFRNADSTDISARGQLKVAPDTRVNVGASVGRVKFLPGAAVGGDDTFDQTTLSVGIEHGPVRGTVVGHMLEPNLPGAALDRGQRWSGIDLGISVRLPWRGELNFGAQNVWTSGHAPLLFGPTGSEPAQGRVPYVQYHQDL